MPAASRLPYAPSPSGQRKKYRGVRRRGRGRWVSEIRLPNSRERIWLGSFDAPEKAARAFDAALVCLRGPAAVDGLNFPGSPPAVGRRTSDAREVRAAAASHANQAAAAAPPETAATTDPATAAHDYRGVRVERAAAVPVPLQVPAERLLDWSELVANPPPLYSPTLTGSHTHLPNSSTAAPADDSAEDDDGRRCPAGLWSFDSGGSC